MKIKFLIIGLLLLGAYGVDNISYYQVLRFVVTIYCGYIAFFHEDHEALHKNWIITYSVIALLFNPIIPFYLGREIWIIVDVIVALILFFSPSLKYNEKNRGEEEAHP